MGSHEARPARILLILAGGTICMKNSENGYIPSRGLLSVCLSGHEAFDDGSRPEGLEVVDEKGIRRPGDASFVLPSTLGAKTDPSVHYTAFEFDKLIDSSMADSHYWNILANCVVANYETFDGFVILHGTDTLAFAASALSFLLNPLSKPVILTGSQVSIFDEPSDAWDNILGSLSIAGQRQIDEVCVFFHGNLYRGNRSIKIHASEYAAFASPNLDPLVSFDAATSKGMGRAVGHSIHDPSVPMDELDALVKMESSQVAVLRIYPGIQPSTLRAILDTPGLRGMVIETFGAGNMPEGPNGELLQIMGDAIKRGVTIVNVSQCLNGTVSPIYAPARALERLGVVYGHDMTTEAAYTKLLYLIACPDNSPADVRRLMSVDLRGELSTARSGIDRSKDEPERSRRRRESLVVTGLAWRTYHPRVVGRSVSRER